MSTTEARVACVVLMVPSGSAMSFGDLLRGLALGTVTVATVDAPETCAGLAAPDPTTAPAATPTAPAPRPSTTPVPSLAELRRSAETPRYLELQRHRDRYLDRPLYLVGRVLGVWEGLDEGVELQVEFEGVGRGTLGDSSAIVEWSGSPVPPVGRRIAMIGRVEPRDPRTVWSLDDLRFTADLIAVLPKR